MSNEYDAGNGTVNGQPASWDTNQDGTVNVFPGGLPRGPHSQMPHDKMVVNGDGGVEYMREGGQEVNNYRDYGSN